MNNEVTTRIIVDEKRIVWRRSQIEVNTAELNQAIAEGRMEQFLNDLNETDYSSFLEETEESISVEDNKGLPTIEVFRDSSMDEVIYKNV